MADLTAEVETMTIAELLEYQQEVTRQRLDALAAGRRAQVEIDRRAAQLETQRVENAALLGQTTKPPTQHLFSEPAEA